MFVSPVVFGRRLSVDTLGGVGTLGKPVALWSPPDWPGVWKGWPRFCRVSPGDVVPGVVGAPGGTVPVKAGLVTVLGGLLGAGPGSDVTGAAVVPGPALPVLVPPVLPVL